MKELKNSCLDITEDGAWSWFSDPRAIVLQCNLITGWVKSSGTVETAIINLSDHSITIKELYFQLEKNDHVSPSFIACNDTLVIGLYTRHAKKDMFQNNLWISNGSILAEKPKLIHPISNIELLAFPRETICYANPIKLSAENSRIYCFGRWTGFKPNMMWSDNLGNSWTKSKVFISDTPFDLNNRPYVKYCSDDESRIHFAFTDGHPRDEQHNSIYHSYYQGRRFFTSNRNEICSLDELPYTSSQATLVYKGSSETGRAWIADIALDSKGNPVILYTRSIEESNHEYWYARFIDGRWHSSLICHSGKWFPHTPDGKIEREPHYFGGLTLNPNNCNIVYLSREINGIFEIERWETKDFGNSWNSNSITSESKVNNVRPYFPRGEFLQNTEIVLWMETQKYIHYTDFKCSIKCKIIELRD